MEHAPQQFGPFTFDSTRMALLREGRPVALGGRGAALLGALLDAKGEVVGKDALIEAAWPGTIVEEGNLSVQIANLRKALGEHPEGGEWIATVPRVGYRFLGTRGQGHAGEGAETRPSLAVLPFTNLGGDPEQDYFADGVVEDIITALSRFRSFAVIARNSSFVYKGRAIDVRVVAAELGVRYVLEGSVRRGGDRLRISAQLVDGTSGGHLWAEQFEGEVGDVFEFQDRITESVASIVEPSILRAEVERARRERPGSLEAYDLYLRSVPLHAASDEANRDAYGLVQRAIAADPGNATYLSAAAGILQFRANMGWPPVVENQKQVALDLVERALATGMGDPMVLGNSGDTLVQYIRDYDRGMALIRMASAANPHNLMTVGGAGVAHLHCGNLDEALTYFHRCIRLSPLDPNANWPLTGIAHVYMVLGRYEDALAWALRSLAVNSRYDCTYWMLIAGNAHLGRMDEARRYLEQFRALRPHVTIASIREGQPAKDPERLRAILDGLHRAGLPET